MGIRGVDGREIGKTEAGKKLDTKNV
jgi:hypothetical protein